MPPALALPAAGAPGSNRVVLPQAVPSLPHGTTQLGAASGAQMLQLDVSLAGQNPSGLAQAVAAVSTPGSPDYRHYLTPAQFASEFGPSAAEVAQVSSVLRAQGLTVGQPLEGSVLLPVSGSVAAVESAFGTTIAVGAGAGRGTGAGEHVRHRPSRPRCPDWSPASPV